MTFGSSLFLIAVGAILRYATTFEVNGVNIDEVGLILMVVGLIGFVLSLLYTMIWAGDRSRFASRDRYGDPRYGGPPPEDPRY